MVIADHYSSSSSSGGSSSSSSNNNKSGSSSSSNNNNNVSKHMNDNMPAMSHQTWTLIIDGRPTTLVLINDNNSNSNNNDNSNVAFNCTSVNPSSCSVEEAMIVELDNSVEEGPSSSSSNNTDENSVSLPVIDFSDLVTVPVSSGEMGEEMQKAEEEDEIITPTNPTTRILDMDDRVSLCEGQTSLPCSSTSTDTFCAGSPDLDRLLSRSSDVSPSSSPFMTAASPHLLLLSPTITTSTPCQLTPTTTTALTTTLPYIHTSLSSNTSLSSLTCSPSFCSTAGPCAVTATQLPFSTPVFQFESSPRTLSSSSCDDVCSSCSDISTSPEPIDDLTSFGNVIRQCVVSGLAMSGGVSMSAGISSLTSSAAGLDVITEPSAGITINTTTTNPTSSSADVITADLIAEAMTSSSDVSTLENINVPAATSANDLMTALGNGAQGLLLSTEPDKMVDAAPAENKMADSNKMAAATLEALETCSLTPLIKEELRYTIQSRRLAAGKPELMAAEYAAVDSGRSVRHRRAMTAEERERYTKRQEQNRKAAQRFRQKQRDTEEVLSKKCRKLEGSNSSLRAEILRLARETQQLQQLMDSHLPHCQRKVTNAAKVTTQ